MFGQLIQIVQTESLGTGVQIIKVLGLAFTAAMLNESKISNRMVRKDDHYAAPVEAELMATCLGCSRVVSVT